MPASSVWTPGLVALGVGLGVGLIVALRLIGRSRHAEAPADDADRALRIRDLERRRDELYERLREASTESLEEERESLELAAARVLQELDSLGAARPSRRPRRARDDGSAAAAVAAGVRHPLLVGFLSGAAMVSVVAVLILWAGRDARPGDAGAERPRATASEDPHTGEGEMSPEAAARVAELLQQLDRSPDDLRARKELALVYLVNGRFLKAFQAAEAIRERRPEDPDGLYVEGVVRLTMGQETVAGDLLDRVLVQYPDHVRALIARGIVSARLGDLDAAVATWERGLAAAGGSQPDLEELLRMARQRRSAGADQASEPSPAGATAEGQDEPVSGAPAAAGSYRIRVELAPGVSARGGSTLFVALRGEAPGPPVAAKRIPRPVFPLEISLGVADSMMGQPLPPRGKLTVRLDADGNASTQGPDDLAAEAEVVVGTAARVVLGG